MIFPIFFFSFLGKKSYLIDGPSSQRCLFCCFACATSDPDLTKDYTTTSKKITPPLLNNLLKTTTISLQISMSTLRQPLSCIDARMRRTCIRNVAQLCSFRWKKKKHEPFSSLFLSRKSLTIVMRGDRQNVHKISAKIHSLKVVIHLLRSLSGFFPLPVFIFFVLFFFFSSLYTTQTQQFFSSLYTPPQANNFL